MRVLKPTLDGNVPVLLNQEELDKLFTKNTQREIKKGGSIFITPGGHIIYYNDVMQCAAEPLAVMAEKRRDLGRAIKKLIYESKRLPLKELRLMSGMTREEFARAARLPRSTLEAYELGRSSIRRANYKRVTAMATLLGVTPDELFLAVKERD